MDELPTIDEPRAMDEPKSRDEPTLLSLGYPADESDLLRAPRTGGRRPLDEVLSRERW